MTDEHPDEFTIATFWRSRIPLAGAPVATKPVVGWIFENRPIQAFQEAPLTRSIQLASESPPETSPILLVAAPGAVGKSTLARQIAFETGAVYVNLAQADPVGGNTISGGLMKSGLLPDWEGQARGLLIDGLDEARLRVTQEAFEAFLGDVADLCRSRTVPTVLFGRTGAVQDAWLMLSDRHVGIAVLEIGYYPASAAVDFACARARLGREARPHASVERGAITLLLQRLREQTEADGDRFAGYAPVLQAIAERLRGEDNPAALLAQIEKGAQAITLAQVVASILDRERGKLDPLEFEDESLRGRLYGPTEQLDRLAARIYGLQPPDPIPMSPADARVYSNALETWVSDHPFLDSGSQASSAVFDAVIGVRALRNPAWTAAAVQRELRRGAAANPFLSEFYLSDFKEPSSSHLPFEHIGIVYGSLRAGLALGDSASLQVEQDEDEADEDGLEAVVEISIDRVGVEQPRILRFKTDQTGILKLGEYVEDVELNIPYGHVEIGTGREVLMIAPVSIQCDKITMLADKVSVEKRSGSENNGVFVEARDADANTVKSVPILRGGVVFKLMWPGVKIHPWTAFASDAALVDDPRLDEALRRFRKLVTAFRSHSKGNLARYKHKIDHARMMKGSGRAVLALMLQEKIIILNGSMYYLDANRLGGLASATYADCMTRNFTTETMAFVSRAL